MAILTAGYLSGVCQRSCAVLEWNAHGSFGCIRKACLGDEDIGVIRTGSGSGSGSGSRSGSGSGSRKYFRLFDVDYYQEAGPETLVLCKTLGYQEVIVDYGTVSEGNQEEFFRCDRPFLLAGLSEWQSGAFLEFVGRWRKAGVSWETLAAFGSEEARKNMEKGLRLRIRRVPVSVDAFAVTETILEFYQQIL